jgi:hypothetical protein
LVALFLLADGEVHPLMIRLEEVDSSFDRSIDISRLYYDGGTADQWCVYVMMCHV